MLIETTTIAPPHPGARVDASVVLRGPSAAQGDWFGRASSELHFAVLAAAEDTGVRLAAMAGEAGEDARAARAAAMEAASGNDLG